LDDAAFSDEFLRFLRTVAPTVDAVELLLLLHRKPDQWWSAQSACRALAPDELLSEADAARYFGVLHRSGVAALAPDGSVQYRPASPELDRLVGTLAQSYLERPVTLIRVVYALRDQNIKSFADAFKLKKD
jgi:hypothetical protein